MPFELRPAVRENVPLLIGLAGSSGSGKTFSAFRLAKGLAGEERFAVIDTESGRAKAYADDFAFDHGELVAPFTPENYWQAIRTIDSLHKYPVIVVDSASHEYAGEGGILDMQEDELQRMAGNDYAKREACKMASWIKPKMAHKEFVNKLLQVRAHLILAFRAEPKTEMAKDEKGKAIVRPKRGLTGLDGWFPICEKSLPYELTAYFLLMADRPGVPQPIKLMEQHKPFFPLDKPISEDAGRALGQWAKGGQHSTRNLFESEAESVRDMRTAIQDSMDEESLKRAVNGIGKLSKAAQTDLRESYRAKLEQIRTLQGLANEANGVSHRL